MEELPKSAVAVSIAGRMFTTSVRCSMAMAANSDWLSITGPWSQRILAGLPA
jgi:hypothetical protein